MGYFMFDAEFEEGQRREVRIRRSRAVADMTREEVDEMTAGRMSAEHDHLNALLDDEKTAGCGISTSRD
jgi:hypothetical protein